jgi:hypothetical protein
MEHILPNKDDKNCCVHIVTLQLFLPEKSDILYEFVIRVFGLYLLSQIESNLQVFSFYPYLEWTKNAWANLQKASQQHNTGRSVL